eukprot:4272890-Pleurochrysis_carterae.AAC.1
MAYLRPRRSSSATMARRWSSVSVGMVGAEAGREVAVEATFVLVPVSREAGNSAPTVALNTSIVQRAPRGASSAHAATTAPCSAASVSYSSGRGAASFDTGGTRFLADLLLP